MGQCEPEMPSMSSSGGRWTAERVWRWYEARPWLAGCNFVPSTAVNDVAMWQRASFDAETIRRELGWAAELGFSSVRVFLNFVVWQADRDGFKARFDRFLSLASELEVSVMPILLDDCNFAGREAAVGPQPDPVPGVHNSGWVSSPPLKMVDDRATWDALRDYVQGFVSSFAYDPRIVIWDLYNEPGNSGMGARSMPLMEAAFAWAREVGPSQPLTVGAWGDFEDPMQAAMLALSDVVSFHAYDGSEGVETKIRHCAALGRPMLCTEWLHRLSGNTFEAILPLFRRNRVGCYNWGLVAGLTQTYMPWGAAPGTPVPALWQHDILHRDGTPYDPREVAFLREALC